MVKKKRTIQLVRGNGGVGGSRLFNFESPLMLLGNHTAAQHLRHYGTVLGGLLIHLMVPDLDVHVVVKKGDCLPNPHCSCSVRSWSYLNFNTAISALRYVELTDRMASSENQVAGGGRPGGTNNAMSARQFGISSSGSCQ